MRLQLRIVTVSFAAMVGVTGVLCPAAAQTLQVGFVIATPDAGNAMAAGSALFAYRNASGVLVSEAGVGAAQPVAAGRIFVDQNGTRTGVAFANPALEAATATLQLRDADGVGIGTAPLTIPARGHTASFVSELFPSLPEGFVGTLTFASDLPLTAITLRETSNQFGEPLYATLPIVDLAQAAELGTVFPQIAIGGGYFTQLILINPGSETLRGEIRLYSSDGTPLLARIADTVVEDIAYTVQPGGAFQVELDGATESVVVGQAVLTPEPGNAAPAGTAVFQVRNGLNVIAEAAAAAEPATTLFRIVVDYIGTQTGIAVANPGDGTADLTLTLRDRYGDIEATVTSTLPARNQMAVYVHELFGSVADGYSGLIEVESTQPVVPVTLKLTQNSRDETVLTTLPVADLTRPPAGTLGVFPHIALGAGFTTRLILLNSSTAVAADGTFAFYEATGNPLPVPMFAETASEFAYSLIAGGGRQFYPGNSADISSVSLVDRRTGQTTTEIVINQGNSLRPHLEIVDDTGTLRDDYYPSITSIDPAIASIDSQGRIRGEQAGFATLSISVGSRLISGIATVVDVQGGGGGFQVTGVVQDQARRLYLASTQDHSVLLADDLTAAPQVYAGISGSAGLINDRRAQSLFNGPSFLALDHSAGSLYVADTANHVIRLVGAGPNGTVGTLAGNGASGSADGSLDDASFRNPQGVALDGRGNLWVADTGNHTIRRINLTTGQVATIAGEAGTSGSADGVRSGARFNAPLGLAVEIESTASQLERQFQGEAPPPVTVLVADSGNGQIRRVDETGRVVTIGQSTVSALSVGGIPSAATLTPTFSSPTAIAVDPAGNIFVSDTGSGEVRTLLRTGELVSAVQPATFSNPTGIAIAEGGRVIIADSDQGAQQLSYGAPEITTISPAEIGSVGGETIEVQGRNFAPDTVVIVAGVVVADPVISDTRALSFEVPALTSGRTTLTLVHRGGLAQSPLFVRPVPLSALPVGYITTFAGGSTFAGEGQPATDVPMNPLGIAIDEMGNVYVADQTNRRVRRVDARTGRVTTVAGNGREAQDGDGGLAIAAAFNEPNGVAFDPSGALLVSDFSIRRIDAATGIVTTIVGGQFGFCGDGGDALAACFNYISGFTVDSGGNIFIADRRNQRVRRVDAETNVITTIAGNGTQGSSGDGGAAIDASLNSPFGIAIDEVRNVLYIADSANDRVRRVDIATDVISTFAGGGSVSEGFGDGLPATSAILTFPVGLAIDASGNLIVADRGSPLVRRVDVETGIITTIAGNGGFATDGDGGPATSASLQDPWAVAVDGAGNIVVADAGGFVVRKVDSRTGNIDTLAGNRRQLVVENDVAATATSLHKPIGVTLDPSGNLFITDAESQLIRKVDGVTGIITTVAGGGVPESGIGDGGSATDAALSTPRGNVAVDDLGNIYIADRFNYRVRRVDAQTREITTVAGNGIDDSSGDGGQATDAALRPEDLALDTQGNLYIVENTTKRIRRMNLASGVISTVAGGGTGTDPGDGGAAIEAVLGSALRIAVDGNDNLFISDYGSGRVWRVDAVTGTMTTVAGGGEDFEENRQAKAVSLFPEEIAFDDDGNLYITDYNYPYGIRKVDAQTQTITTVAGDDVRDLGDNGPARDAFLFYPSGVAVDAAGNLYIADTDNDRIRVVRGPIP